MTGHLDPRTMPLLDAHEVSSESAQKCSSGTHILVPARVHAPGSCLDKRDTNKLYK
jgi:hypothetical protein